MTICISENRVVSIFWPCDLLDPSEELPLVIVGYIIDMVKVVAIDLVPLEIYEKINLSKHVRGLKRLQALGTINFHSKQIPRRVNYNYAAKRPILNSNELLILYKPPRSGKLEYFSIDPIAINIFWTSTDFKSPMPKDIELDRYSSKLEYHFPSHSTTANTKELLRYINLTEYSRSRLRQASHQRSPISEYATFCKSSFEAILRILASIYSLVVQPVCGYINFLLEYPLIAKADTRVSDEDEDDEETENEDTSSPIVTGSVISLALVSHTFHQLNSRFKQLYNLPDQLQKLRLSRSESETLILKGTKFSPTVYIKFYNTVWLIINDILMGITVSNLLRLHKEEVIWGFSFLLRSSHNIMSSNVIWLMNSPAGFKLNNELARFFGEMILWTMKFWEVEVIQPASENAALLLSIAIFCVRYCGVSLLVALMVDVFQLLTLELQGFYTACTRVYHWLYHTLTSLFRLFYGKKYNVLRHRIDSNDYEFDELMSGIIIFTILLYLLPTVAAFYLTFVGTRIICFTIVVLMEFILISLNHLPLGVILLRLKNKERLPAGISITASEKHFTLSTKWLTMHNIFRGHIRSMMNFNLINYNEVYAPINENHPANYGMQDVITNWNKASPMTISKDIFLGEMIDTFDYKKMF
ncbi:hypothetical protein FOA43_000180 [Brettanomyces nanus]|uniref:Uncharacterized protein n=1 Tax=Eeniella nana TaxID=13502 RepID=A0A875RSU7_EENNA|nr:uncharacterized protein FOA43_000180 [Brettanomyces nanus]QPG72877.1 hypothetical protein FOA43_000180 [Brettanomyces nanus]